MDRYSRILIIIFFLCLINLGLSIFAISKLNNESENVKAPIVFNSSSPSPSSTNKPTSITTDSEIKSDLTLIKAEIRGLREILGTTKSFEELSTLIKSLNSNEP